MGIFFKTKLSKFMKIYQDEYDCVPMTIVMFVVIVLLAITSGMSIHFIIDYGLPILFIWGVAVVLKIVIDQL